MTLNTGNHTARILLVGASTGGPEAVRALLAGIGPDFPLPVLVTQHIDAAFGASFPQWLAETTGVRVELARENVIPQPGCVYVAPPKRHLIVKKTWSASVCMLGLDDGPLVHFVRPSVDMLFMSAARVLGDGCLAVLLTGMGKDGAAGCREICRKGGTTIVESAETCAIFGMPRAAIEYGAASVVLPLYNIPVYLRHKVLA